MFKLDSYRLPIREPNARSARLAKTGHSSAGNVMKSLTKPSERKAFAKEIEGLRRQGGIEPAEIARRALKAGLRPHEALEEIRDYLEYRSAAEDPFYWQSTEFTEGLALFVKSLCDHKSSD
jgi:hypothetical protein